MFRTSELAKDAKTARLVRPIPPQKALSFKAQATDRRAVRLCNPFSESSEGRMQGAEVPDPDGGAPGPSAPYRTGAIIAGRYRLKDQLGRGGMGEVWSAEHLALNTEVAVKFLSTGAGGTAVKAALERFRFEAQVSAHLGLRTSHVVAVHDAGSDGAGPYLVMERVCGQNLRMELSRRGPLEPQVFADILDQVVEALSVAHDFGIVHRDLKPSNLLLIEEPGQPVYVKVADFGIAKALRSDLAVDPPEETSDGFMLGSPAYMSPEQMSGGVIDPRSDMWALGVIAYEALTGVLPFPGRSVAEIIVNMSIGRFDLPSRIRPSLPGKIDDWFLQALAKRKERRFESVEEMAREFRIALASRPVRPLPRAVRVLMGWVSLAAALLALRPAPSKALPETVVSSGVTTIGAQPAIASRAAAAPRRTNVGRSTAPAAPEHGAATSPSGAHADRAPDPRGGAVGAVRGVAPAARKPVLTEVF